jgi:hypothetical protein
MISGMPDRTSALPSDEALTAVLRSAMTGGALVEILGRHPNEQGTFQSEVLTCRVGASGEFRLQAKYGGHTGANREHRGGVEYEAQVYRHVLDALGLSTPRLFATHFDDRTQRGWLLIEHIDRGLRVWHDSQLVRAASWIGRFQRLSRVVLEGPAGAVLKRYDAAYYGHCAREFLAAAAAYGARLPWLEALCEGFERLAPALAEREQAICHGEYGPKNILVTEDRVAPVDWETAAIGLGEIDLATLTQGWSDEVTRECELVYSHARWPTGAPPHWTQSLKAARVYIGFRWPTWTQRKSPAQLDAIRQCGEALGLIR